MTGLASADTARQLVPGDPDVVAQLARHLGTYGYGAADASTRLRRIGTDDWIGSAAQAFRHQVGEVPAKLSRGASAFQEASQALEAHAQVLRGAQGDAGAALAAWRTALALTEQWKARPVGDDPGAVGRSQAEYLLAGALRDVRLSGTRLADVMDRAAAGAPHQPGLLSRTWHAVTSFAKGAAEATWGLAQFAYQLSPDYMLLHPVGYLKNIEALGKGLAYGVEHPEEFGKAMIDWDTWQKDPARALGHLLPDLVLTVATAGAGGAAKGADAASRLERIGTVADRLGTTVFPTLSDSVLDQRVADLGYDLASPSGRAARFQLGEPYGGVDSWMDKPLTDGTLVAFGAPGISGFGVVVEGPLGTSAREWFERLQVSTRRSSQLGAPTQRGTLKIYRVKGTIPAARAVALRNPQFGSGGGSQVFVDGFSGQPGMGLDQVAMHEFAPGTLRTLIEDPRFRAIDPGLPTRPLTVAGATRAGQVQGGAAGLAVVAGAGCHP